MTTHNNKIGEFLLYTTEDGKSRVECRFENETIWLSQALMAELFDRDVRTINEHLQNPYEEAELAPEATIRKFRMVRPLFTCRKTDGSRTFSMRVSVTRSPGFPDNCRLRKIGWGSNPQVRQATLRGASLFGSGFPWIEIHGYASDVATRRSGVDAPGAGVGLLQMPRISLCDELRRRSQPAEGLPVKINMLLGRYRIRYSNTASVKEFCG